MTVECPDKINVPENLGNLCETKNYWILSASTVYHNGRRKEIGFNLEELKVGDTIGCSIHEDGTLHYFVNGKDRGVVWDDKLPINQAVYGIVDVCRRVKRISLLFHYGKYVQMYAHIATI